ncbi:hypothetical protein QCA50_002640 [Cerrena zonata]|uniref:DUF6534 domain-containing protein n=1 Tax=Cerrena zonata TaxID=2478898 RepID=A0AAW0GIF8_9APHY
MGDVTAPPLSIPQLLGGMLVAVSFAFMLYGVTSAQAYIFFMNSYGDPQWMKALVGAVWFLETAHSAFVIRQLYYMVIISFGDFDSIGKIDWSLACMTLMEIFIILLVEGYYIWRIWILSNRSRILNVVLVDGYIHNVGFTACTGVYTLLAGTWENFQGSFGPNFSVIMTNSFSAVIDSLIAITMIILLRRGQKGFNYNMDSVLRWIMTYTVNTGAISMVISVIIAITYSTLRENLIFAGLVVLTGKLYANALLGMLNARNLMRRRVTLPIDPNMIGLSGFNISSPSQHSRDWHNHQRSQRGAQETIILTNGNRGPAVPPKDNEYGLGTESSGSPRQTKPPLSPSWRSETQSVMVIEVKKSVEIQEDI